MVYVITSLIEVLQTHLVHWEEAYSGTILRTHVGDCSSVSDGELGHSRTVKLHKLTNNTNLSQVLVDKGITTQWLTILTNHTTTHMYMYRLRLTILHYSSATTAYFGYSEDHVSRRS